MSYPLCHKCRPLLEDESQSHSMTRRLFICWNDIVKNHGTGEECLSQLVILKGRNSAVIMVRVRSLIIVDTKIRFNLF